jgi:hypothetical protein
MTAMSDSDPELVPWNDPLGTVRPDFCPRRASRVLETDVARLEPVPAEEVAPIFCDLFGSNVFMVRKHFGWDYPIIPNFLCCRPGWLFYRPGPPDQSGPEGQEYLVDLERRIGNPGFFGPCRGSFAQSLPAFHCAVRTERVLRWIRRYHPAQFARLRRAGEDTAGDLTTADDRLVEVVVASLVVANAAISASDLSFIPTNGSKTPEFYVRTRDLNVVLEVKHIHKHPEDARQSLWLDTFRTRRSSGRAFVGAFDLAFSALQRELDHLPAGSTAYEEADPRQKDAKSILEHLRRADDQLEQVTDVRRRVIVLYSDDPHTLTEGEPRENRIEAVIRSYVKSLKADAVVVLAHPYGFPLASGHCYKAFSRNGGIPEELNRLFGGLPALETLDMRVFAMGAQGTLAPNGEATQAFDPSCP